VYAAACPKLLVIGGKESLPAIAAITAVATISTIAAAPSTAATMSAPSTATATKAAAATPTSARLLRARFIDHQVAPTEVLSVHRIDRAIRFFVVRDFNECESARLAREPVANEINCRGIDASLCEKIMQ